MKKVKTQLCQFYLDGFCKKGDKCLFAHGEDQLRKIPVQTKKCMYGRRYCKFGDACRFIHEDDQKLHVQQQTKSVSNTKIEEEAEYEWPEIDENYDDYKVEVPK